METFLSVGAGSSHDAAIQEYVEQLIARECTRPEWCVAGMNGESAVGRAAFWATPGGPVPTDLVVIETDWSDAELTSGRALLEAMHERARGLGAGQLTHHVDEPAGPPQYQENPDARVHLLEAAGYELVRDGLRWIYSSSSPAAPVVAGPLVYRALPEVGDDAFLEAFTATHEGTRDAWLRREIEELGLQAATRAEYDAYREMDYAPEWWELAYARDGELAGAIMGARNPTSAVIGHVGVLPAQRGRGFAAELVRRGTEVLLRSGADEIRADCDSDNVPMVKAFQRAGYEQIARRRSFQLELA
jgi:ribosomal protein S18 acetylase RimI-like enzyme